MMRLRATVLSPNRGSRVPESIFSPISSSPPKQICSHGRRHFQTLRSLPLITPTLYPLAAVMLSRPQMRERAVGSRAFLVPCTCRWAVEDCWPACSVPRILTHRQIPLRVRFCHFVPASSRSHPFMPTATQLSNPPTFTWSLELQCVAETGGSIEDSVRDPLQKQRRTPGGA